MFSCWNVITAFVAKPLMDGKIRFRTPSEGECYAGKPTLFCMDMWKEGYRKIDNAPTVNMGFEDSFNIMDVQRTVSSWTEESDPRMELIE